MSRRKLFLHNDEFINQKAEVQAEDLWKNLSSKYSLKESIICSEYLKSIKPITYAYLHGFVDFYQKIDNGFCITAIYKTQDANNAGKDIMQCLVKRGWAKPYNPKKPKQKYPTIYYIDYQFATDYECPHGDDYKDVYLMLFTPSEDETLHILQKFDKLKAFV